MGGIADAVTGLFEGAPDAPDAPNPYDIIRAQQEAQQIFQFTPTGNLEYGTVGSGGEFVVDTGARAAKVSESDFQKAFREGREGLTLDMMARINPNQIGELRTSRQIESGLGDIDTDFVAAGDRYEQEMFADTEARLRDSYDSRREDLIQNLADRGIPLSSEAGQAELNRLDEAYDEGLSRASFGALQAGRQEQDRLTRLSAALRGQSFGEQTALAGLEQQQRAQRFGEIGSLAGFGGQFQNINPTAVNAAGILGQGYANQMSQYQQQLGQYQQGQQQLGGLLSAGAAFFSDIRLKENIKFSHLENNHKIYQFNYKGGNKQYSGVMAQDVLKYRPEAVFEDSGYYKVDYSQLGVEMKEVE